jgi:microcystin-dependent protein
MDPFIGTIVMFGGTFAPRNWAFCEGQLLSITQHQALFSIIGTTYGGDGRTTFALPDLRGRVPVHPGQGTGLSPRAPGQRFGEETVTLTTAQIPAHSHAAYGALVPAEDDKPWNNVLGESTIYTGANSDLMELNPATIGTTGGGAAHDNIQPSLCVNFIIALYGAYPSRS